MFISSATGGRFDVKTNSGIESCFKWLGMKENVVSLFGL
jgi:hypothetical protein